MPWKETDVMELKKEFVARALRAESSFMELCREYGISAKTGYKWKERFSKHGVSGLLNQSRRPHSSPNQVCEDDICRLINLKLAHRYILCADVLANSQAQTVRNRFERLFET